MSALRNHTIDARDGDGYGRCRQVSVWKVSAVQDEWRVVFFFCIIMDEQTGKKRRYRVSLTTTTQFLDVLAESASEAEEIARANDESLFHDIEDDGFFEVRELRSDESYHPINYDWNAES